MKVTEMDIINAQIEYNDVDNKEITKNILKEWRNSDIIAQMKEAEAYSLVKNTKIDEKTRTYKDDNGKLIVNNNLSNVKTKTAQYRKSLKQKVDFTMAKPFIISCDDDKYKEEWDNFLTDENRAVIRLTAKNGINYGIGWTYTWIDENGDLQLVNVNSQTVYPAWTDEAHTELDAAVRDYKVIEYENQTASEVTKVEYWDRQVVEKYIDYSNGEGTGNSLEVDTEGKELDENEKEMISVSSTHMQDKDGNGVSWERVPFIFLKGDEDELPLLNECKDDIDTYDMVKSKGIDSILDDIDAVLVVEGIGAEMGELARARRIVQNSRIIAIDPGGSAKFEKVNSDITAIARQLDLIKKDIQDNTNTVDVTTIALGSNPSGKAMKTFYEPLNTWTNGFEAQFRVYMKNLKYFFDKWLSWKGGLGTFEELQEKEVTFTLDRDMLIDEDQIIENIMKLGDEISQETRDELNPYVESHEKEEERRKEDKEKAKEEDELYNFGKDVNNEEENSEEEEEKEEKPSAQD